MPRLHNYREPNACHVLTAIRGAVGAFQLSPKAEKKSSRDDEFTRA